MAMNHALNKYQKLLKESEEKLRAISECSHDAIILIDEKGLISYVNPAVENIFGYAQEDVLGKNLHEFLVSEEAKKKYFENLPEFSRTGKCIVTGRPLRITCTRRDSTSFPAELFVTAFKVEGKWHSAGIIRDISATKYAEEIFIESEERFRSIFEYSPVGISVVNQEGMIIHCNPAYRKMLGYEHEEMRRKFIEFTHPDDHEENMRLFNEMVQGSRDQFMLIKRYIKKDGSIVWANTTVTAIRGRGGEFKYNFAIVEDISEKKRLEDQLRHAQKMEAIGQLAGGVAHDFNNILTAITGFGNLIKMRVQGDDSLRHYIEQILAVTERGAHLTKSLLAYSKKQQMSLRPVNLVMIIENISRILPRIIGERIEIRVMHNRESLCVNADSSQIEQVLINLATNARDAMKHGGLLTIETGLRQFEQSGLSPGELGVQGGYAYISVSDTGVGIEQDYIDKIFEPFFTTKALSEGTGLGLSIVYGIIKQHNGYITVSSEVDRGTTFDIYIPICRDKVNTGQRLTQSEVTGGSGTILIAEDDAQVRSALKSVLGESGYIVIEARNGEDALEKFRVGFRNIDLVICDMIMPKKSGREIYDEMKRIMPGVKVLFISGYSTDFLKEQGMLEDGVNYIAKPINPDQLVLKIEDVLQ